MGCGARAPSPGRHLQKPARGKAAAVVDGMGVKHRAPTTGHVEAGSIRTICPEHLIPNSFHILEQNLLTATVIEFRGPAVSVTSDPLSGLQGAVIFQKIRDAGGPE